MEVKVEVEKKESTSKREITPLEKHIRYFGGDRPEGISYTSITERNESLGDGYLAARTNAAIVSGASGAKVIGCPFSMFKAKQAVGVLNHPYSTRIFNLDGTINEARWNELLEYSEPDENGEKIITEHQLYQFLEACRKQETRPDPLGFALKASNGEWSAYFSKFAEPNVTFQGNRFVTIEKLRTFYEDSQEVGEEVEHRVGKTL